MTSDHDSIAEPTPTGGNRYEDWIALVKRSARLPAEVPREIADIFEACAGAVMSGWAYSPLLALGADQVAGLRDRLARAACERHGAAKSQTRTGAACVDFLVARGLLPAERGAAWERGGVRDDTDELPATERALRFISAFCADARALFPSVAVRASA